jgi:hypothetical protein
MAKRGDALQIRLFTKKKHISRPLKKRPPSPKLLQTLLEKYFTKKKHNSTPLKKRPPSPKLRQTQLDTFFAPKSKK